jgi:magnesium chelatase family protein
LIDKYIIWASCAGWQLTTHIRGHYLSIKAKEKRVLKVFFFQSKMKEAAIVTGLDVYGVENVQEVIDFLEGKSRTNNNRYQSRVL